jgi:hypothetical protein
MLMAKQHAPAGLFVFSFCLSVGVMMPLDFTPQNLSVRGDL